MAVYYHHADIMRQIATLLGKPDDAGKYAVLAEAICQSFQQQFFDPATGLYAKDSQTAQALPLCFGMVPKGERPLAEQQLLNNIRDTRKDHVSSGIVGTLYLFYTLMALDRNDVAYAMAVQEDYPGWGNMVRNGATTVWEQWNGTSSLNHPALGAADVWFYQALTGIRPDLGGPGFEKVIVKPAVVGDLTWAKASYKSMYGTIRSDWKREGQSLLLHVAIPANTTAAVYVPAGNVGMVMESGQPAINAVGVNRIVMEGNYAVIDVDSGDYTFSATVD
jgi:alpha-L-rhamnosidase